jgi:hypothetical protein
MKWCTMKHEEYEGRKRSTVLDMLILINATPFIPKYLLCLICTLILTIRLIKKTKVMKKLKYIFKLHYVINYIIFDFFITLIFLIRQMIKVKIKIKGDKYFGIERVKGN